MIIIVGLILLVVFTVRIRSVLRATGVTRWARAAVTLFLATCTLYAWGLFHVLGGGLRRDKTCEFFEGAGYVPGEARESFLPLSSTCNAHHDMVPGYVNPGLAVLCAATLAAVAAAVTLAVRGPRPPGSR
ncbi:hypothetical protein ACFWJT_16245 [Streptomyces sp. NPDC127069]|uniref:hypothetical protein n=1 Tax=Streptomyces sp. NPDC127069 TaxID=3347128 RepID=UPI003646E6AB